jgi:tetratricopeptide (TPR) repeat protein
LETAFHIQRNPDLTLIDNIYDYCWKSNNKQLIDQAGQTFGRLGDIEKSIKFLERSVKLDPMSPNSLLSLAISYHLDRKIKEEKPIILKLLKILPEDPQVLRLAVQVAGLSKDKKMSEKVLSFISLYNKDALPMAKKFIENAFKN